MSRFEQLLAEELSNQGSVYHLSHNAPSPHIPHGFNAGVPHNHASVHFSPSAQAHHNTLTQHGFKLHTQHTNQDGHRLNVYAKSGHPTVTVRDHGHSSSWMVHDGHAGGFNHQTHQQVHMLPHSSSYGGVRHSETTHGTFGNVGVKHSFHKQSLTHAITRPSNQHNTLDHESISHGHTSIIPHLHPPTL